MGPGGAVMTRRYLNLIFIGLAFFSAPRIHSAAHPVTIRNNDEESSPITLTG